jgi:hypothetical protein
MTESLAERVLAVKVFFTCMDKMLNLQQISHVRTENHVVCAVRRSLLELTRRVPW